MKSVSEEGLYTFSFYNCFQPDIFGAYGSTVLKSSINKLNKTFEAENANIFELSDNYFMERNQADFKYGIELDVINCNFFSNIFFPNI